LKSRSARLSVVILSRGTPSSYFPSLLDEAYYPHETKRVVSPREDRGLPEFLDFDWTRTAYHPFQKGVLNELGKWLGTTFYSGKYMGRAILSVLFGRRPFCHRYWIAPEFISYHWCLNKSVFRGRRTNYQEYFQFPSPAANSIDGEDDSPHIISLYPVGCPLYFHCSKSDVVNLTYVEGDTEGNLRKVVDDEPKEVFEIVEGGVELPVIRIDTRRRKIPPAWVSPVTWRMNEMVSRVSPKDLQEGNLMFLRNLKAFNLYLPLGWETAVWRKLEIGWTQDRLVTAKKRIPLGYLNGYTICLSGRKLRVQRLQRLVKRAFDPRYTWVMRIDSGDILHADFKSEMFLYHLRKRFGTRVRFLRFRLPRQKGGVTWYFFVYIPGRSLLPSEVKYLKDYKSRSWEYRKLMSKFGIRPYWAAGKENKESFYRARSLKHLTYLISQLKYIPRAVFAVIDVLARLNRKLLIVDTYTTSRNLDIFTHRRKRYPSREELFRKGVKRGLLKPRHKDIFLKKQTFKFEPSWFHMRFPYTGFGKALRVCTGAERADPKYNGVLRKIRAKPLIPSSIHARFAMYFYDEKEDVLRNFYHDFAPDLSADALVPSVTTLRILEIVRSKFIADKSESSLLWSGEGTWMRGVYRGKKTFESITTDDGSVKVSLHVSNSVRRDLTLGTRFKREHTLFVVVEEGADFLNVGNSPRTYLIPEMRKLMILPIVTKEAYEKIKARGSSFPWPYQKEFVEILKLYMETSSLYPVR